MKNNFQVYIALEKFPVWDTEHHILLSLGLMGETVL